MNPPLSFLWNHLKALYTKFVERVRHYAVSRGFQWNLDEEEAFLLWLLDEDLFD